MKRTIIASLLTLVALAGQAQEPFSRTDSAVVRGRIVDYSTDKDFRSISALVPDVFTGENSNVTAEIRQDGTFEKHLLLLNHNVGQRLFESKEDMLPIQLMQLHVVNDAMEQWMCEGTIEEDFSAVKPFLKHPAVSMMAQQFYEEMLAYEPTLPLPEGAAADFIKDILKQYPNRYIILDFWAMYCGPCKMEIKDTRNFRQRLHEREDVKFVFLANESNPKNRAYLDFVNEHLKDEANIVIDDTRLRQLQDLFGFAGLPYNVTLTPDGRIVREGLLLRQFELGYDSFIQRLEEMKEEVGFIEK